MTASSNEPARRSFWVHLHAPRVTERALHPATTLGLGIVAVTLGLVTAVTGALLMLYYVPSPTEAYASVVDLQHAIPFGAFVRAAHRWAAHGMVAAVALHLVRVGATAAYRARAANWIAGLALLLLTLGLAFTGYLLPWDQLSYWAVSVAAGMLEQTPLFGPWLKELALGGTTVGGPTLIRFYSLHVFLLPAALMTLVGWHVWRVRKDGGLAASTGHAPTVPAWPSLVLREGALAVWVVALVSVAAVLWDAPLGSPHDPHTPSNPEKAPWYFLGIQEAVSYSTTVGSVILPGAIGAFLALFPFIDRGREGTGAWFGDSTQRRTVLVSALLSTVALIGMEAAYLPAPLADPLLRDVLNPATGMLTLSALLTLAALGWTRSGRAALLAGGTSLGVALIGFTAMGLCRGPDWIFYWPWEDWPHVL